MKPTVIKVWACGACKKPYYHDERGKQMAELCCTCVDCKKEGADVQGHYVGAPGICRACKNKRELQAAEENYSNAKDRLERAQRGRP